MERPLSISIISYLVIISACVSVGLLIFQFFKMPDFSALFVYLDIWELLIIFVIGPLILVTNIIAVVAMLKGKGWGRTLFLAVCIIDFVFLAIDGDWDQASVRSVVRSAFFLFFLYRPKVTDYFNFMALVHKNEKQKNVENTNP